MPNPQPQQHKESNVVQLAASISPATVSEESRSVEMLFYTGAKVERYDWSRGEKYFLRLSIEKGECQIGKLKNAPLLDSHMDYSVRNVLGVITSPSLEPEGCVATATFSDDPESDITFRKVKNGTLRNLSVGAVILSLKLESKEGETPTYVADKWYPREVSIVPLGADPDAHFLSDQLPIEKLMDQSTEQPGQSPLANKEHIMPEANTSLAADPTSPATEPKTEPAVDLAAATKEAAELAVKTERERVAGVQSALKAAKLSGEFADQLIAGNISLADARGKIIDELARLSELAPTNSHHSTTGNPDPMAKLEADAAVLAATDKSLTKHQHFARLLRANPKTYNDSVAV